MTAPPNAELVGRISPRGHDESSKLEIPQWWLVSFPRFTKALEHLKKIGKYIDGDWTRLDIDLAGVVFHRLAHAHRRGGGRRQRVVYGDHFTHIKGHSRFFASRYGGPPLRPKGSAGKFSERQKLVMAGRPRPAECESCGRDHPKIVWDHDHETEAFRGWICQDCNIALGCVADSVDRLRSLISYLQRG